MQLYVNRRSQPVDLERARDLVLDFCLFDRSYEKYDLCKIEVFDPQKAVELAYKVGARSPIKKEKLVQDLTTVATKISKLLAHLSKHSLDEVDD